MRFDKAKRMCAANARHQNFRNGDFRDRGRDADIGIHFGVPTGRGLVIDMIDRNSVLVDSGLRRGDVFISLHGRPIRTEAEFVRWVHAPGRRHSPVSIRRLASSGHLVPANLEVALSEDFVQPGREPLHAQVFTNSVRNIVLPPLLDNWAALEDAVHSSIMTLLIAPVITDLEALTLRIDEQSQTVLSPEEEEPSDEASSEAP